VGYLDRTFHIIEMFTNVNSDIYETPIITSAYEPQKMTSNVLDFHGGENVTYNPQPTDISSTVQQYHAQTRHTR
jgi:hypothetical protein